MGGVGTIRDWAQHTLGVKKCDGERLSAKWAAINRSKGESMLVVLE